MITQRYNLNLIPDKVPVIVNCSQYDALSRTIEMVIYDGSTVYEIPSGTSASVRGTKQDNTGFEYPCTIDGSVVSFDIQDQMTIFAGRVPCEIRLSKDGGIIGTCNFLLNVEETPLDPDVTISETDLPLLERAEQNAIRSEEAADRSTDEADRAKAEADRAEAAVANAVKSVNNILPDSQGNVDVETLPSGGTQGQYLVKQSSTDGDATWQVLPTFVQTVNNVAPTNGNVDVETLPSGGTVGQVLTKQSSVDGDADWETAGMWHGDEVGSLPVPINADQLQGHEASYFQPLLTAGTGISISNGTISNTLLHTVITPAITLSASTNITSYVPIDAVVVEVAPLGKTAFARFAKNVSGSQWWVKLTDLEDATITGSYQLEIKYIL